MCVCVRWGEKERGREGGREGRRERGKEGGREGERGRGREHLVITLPRLQLLLGFLQSILVAREDGDAGGSSLQRLCSERLPYPAAAARDLHRDRAFPVIGHAHSCWLLGRRRLTRIVFPEMLRVLRKEKR